MSDLPPAPPSPVRRRRVWILLRFVVVALVVVAAGLFFTRRQVGDRPVRSLDEWLSANGVFVSWQSVEWLPGVGVQLHGLALYRDAASRVVSLARGILGSARSYDATNGLLQSATHSWSNTSGSGTFTYSYPHYDARRRITERDASPGISWTNIHYDSISQLTGAVVTTSNPTFSYSYDGRGNRNGGQGFSQTPNTLDQINSRASASRGYGVVGSVNPAAQVSVLDSLSGSWQGLSVNSTTGAFSGWWNVPTSVNSGAAVLVNLTVRGTLAGGGANGTPAIADSNLSLLVPATAESPQYDGAGRLAEDALWTYSWDSLDRLLQMDRKAGTFTVTGSDGERMNFGYDADGRRTQCWHTVAYTDGHTNVEFRQVLYSGNLPVMEDEYLNGTKTRRRWFQWGADVNGTLEGAAGVGGLVAIYEEGARTLLLVDDGLGNVVAVVDANTHQMVAHYDYGPFGESLSASGDVDACPFRWQTRWYDKESDTYCFPNRYYSPRMGRWLSRDPMGEAGGFNLYAYGGNDPINRHDPLGLDYYGNYYGDVLAFQEFQRKNPLSTSDPNFAAKFAEYQRLDFRAARALGKMQDLVAATNLYNEYARMWHAGVPELTPYEFDDESPLGKQLLSNLRLKGVIKVEEALLAVLPLAGMSRAEGLVAGVSESSETMAGGKIFNPADFSEQVAKIRGESLVRHGADFPGAEAMFAMESGLRGARRLSAAELATGQRLEALLGKALKESPHEGAEYIDELTGKTYDALGNPRASLYWNANRFFRSIDSHLLKSNDFTVIDLTGFTPVQISEVAKYLEQLNRAQLDKIIKIGF